MVVLGIDPGLAHTGWGVVESRGMVCRARAYGEQTGRHGKGKNKR